MSWKQVLSFNVAKMGTRKGWCLQNTRLGFGINTGKYASAKADMESQKRNGTLHPFNTIPMNCAVPVYLDTVSKYEHIEVCDHGTWYSDGKRVNAPNASYVFGWGEFCDGKRVVEWVNDPKKTNEQLAKEVIAGAWGNGAERKRRLQEAGYDYNAIQAIVDQLLKPNKKSNEEIAREVIAGKWGNGAERKRRLEQAGYNYNMVQAIVNKLMRR